MSINEQILKESIHDYHHSCRNCGSLNTYVKSESLSTTKQEKRIVTYAIVCIECNHLSWSTTTAPEDYYVPEEHSMDS